MNNIFDKESKQTQRVKNLEFNFIETINVEIDN